MAAHHVVGVERDAEVRRLLVAQQIGVAHAGRPGVAVGGDRSDRPEALREREDLRLEDLAAVIGSTGGASVPAARARAWRVRVS
ncbi:MAG: hypothetical protein R2736_02530 [Solirubrobacterales bacterium]